MSSKRRRTTVGCPPTKTSRTPKSFGEVVAQYVAQDQYRNDHEHAWFARQSNFETLLEKAVMSRTPPDERGRELRHPHQRRLPEAVLRKAHRALAKCDLQSCRSFDELHDLIERTAGSIPGIGALAVYDFAFRIGAGMRPKLQPKKVYLHSGTRVGAQALGLGRGRKSIERHELAEEFRHLSARHAEDCLCIYKADLMRIAPRQR